MTCKITQEVLKDRGETVYLVDPLELKDGHRSELPWSSYCPRYPRHEDKAAHTMGKPMVRGKRSLKKSLLSLAKEPGQNNLPRWKVYSQ